MKVEYSKEQFDKWWEEGKDEIRIADDGFPVECTRTHPSVEKPSDSVVIVLAEEGLVRRIFVAKDLDGVK